MLRIKSCNLNGVESGNGVEDLPKNEVHEWLILILLGDENSIHEVINVDNVADHVLQECLDPLEPVGILLFFGPIIHISIHGGEMAIQIRLSELVTDKGRHISDHRISVIPDVDCLKIP